MNIALIFAGGAGTRMNAKDKPKQFLMVHGKPIIVHTIERFQEHGKIDGIIVVCIEEWISYMEDMKFRYRLEKIDKIVPGGETGQLSIFNGLLAAEKIYGLEDNIVLIHDGVRPLITYETITNNIKCVEKYGSCITCAKVKETVVLVNPENSITEVIDRPRSRIARAPQSFYLADVIKTQRSAVNEGNTNMIDTSTLMRHYGVQLHAIDDNSENIKITTPEDFYMFRAIYDARENEQLE